MSKVKETQLAHIKNLLGPSYNLAAMVNDDYIFDNKEYREMLLSEAKKSIKNIEIIKKMTEQTWRFS